MRRLASLTVVLWAFSAGSVGAQEPGTEPGSGSEAPAYSSSVDISEFAPAPPGSAGGRVSAPLMVTLAYGAVWLLTLGFVFGLWRRGVSLSEDLASANSRLAELDARLSDRLSVEGTEPE